MKRNDKSTADLSFLFCLDISTKSYYTKNVRFHTIGGVHLNQAIKRFNHLIGETDAVYHEMSLKSGLSDSAMKILYTICDCGECCLLHEICRRSGMSKQTANSALRKLESEGIVFLEAANAKNKNVRLSEKGKKLAQKTAMKILQFENEIWASWPQKDVEKYLELTEDFLIKLREKAKNM